MSPSVNSSDDSNHGQLVANTILQNDVAATRRIRPGTKAEDMHSGPPLIPLAEIDSAFPLTEHLKALHLSHVINSSSTTQSQTSSPIDKETARQLARPPPGVDRGIWLYELCRFLTQKANAIVVALFGDSPACSATTCPEMRASEWQYLCAAHEPPKSCCAIDYCCHTLDWCATSLTSTKLFPSRLSLGTETMSSNAQIRKMTEIFRRVYRIFAHAWFSHHDAFWSVERETGIYVFFKTVCDEYKLIQEDNYTIPPQAEGIDNMVNVPFAEEEPFVPALLRRDTVRPEHQQHEDREMEGNTTKRHKPGLSGVGAAMSKSHVPERSASVSTVIHEEVEEDDEDVITSPEHEVRGTGAIEVLSDELQGEKHNIDKDAHEKQQTAGAADDSLEDIVVGAAEEGHEGPSEPLGEFPPSYEDSGVKETTPESHVEKSAIHSDPAEEEPSTVELEEGARPEVLHDTSSEDTTEPEQVTPALTEDVAHPEPSEDATEQASETPVETSSENAPLTEELAAVAEEAKVKPADETSSEPPNVPAADPDEATKTVAD